MDNSLDTDIDIDDRDRCKYKWIASHRLFAFLPISRDVSRDNDIRKRQQRRTVLFCGQPRARVA